MKLKKEDYFKNNRWGLDLGPVKNGHNVDYSLVSPFARSWIAMTIAAVIAVIFSASGYSVLQMAISNWQQADDLFNLVSALFTTFWLMGWSVGIIVPLLALIVMAWGRQVLLIHSGRVDIIMGIPGLGFRISAAATEVIDVHLVDHESTTVFPKSGSQIKIETSLDDKNTAFGSSMTMQDVSQIKSAIARNKVIPSGLDAFPDKSSETNPETKSQTATVDALVLQQHKVGGQLESLNEPVTLTSSSTLFLLAANLVPLIGVFLFDWDLGATMVLYWAETAIILLFTVAKGIARNKVLGLVSGLFTISHAGAFMAMHFLFIWTIFVQSAFDGNSLGDGKMSTVLAYLFALWPALLALFISHGYSFKANFLDKQQLHKDNDNKKEKEEFYSRIVLMHITIIVGGGLALILGDGVFALSLLILMKIVIDVKAHLKHHSKIKNKHVE